MYIRNGVNPLLCSVRAWTSSRCPWSGTHHLIVILCLRYDRVDTPPNESEFCARTKVEQELQRALPSRRICCVACHRRLRRGLFSLESSTALKTTSSQLPPRFGSFCETHYSSHVTGPPSNFFYALAGIRRTLINDTQRYLCSFSFVQNLTFRAATNTEWAVLTAPKRMTQLARNIVVQQFSACDV